MSISSRITEIEQHIGNAYDKIEDLGIDLTDVDKNIDNISSMLEGVWNEYPKVTITDVTEASVDGTKKGRIGIDLKGQTEQEQLTGKNLFDTLKQTKTENGITITPNDDGSLSITGTSTKGLNTPIVNPDNVLTLETGTYIRSVIVEGTIEKNDIAVLITGRNSDNTNVMGDIAISSNNTSSKSSTLNETNTMSNISLYCGGAGVTFNCKIYLQIEQGSTATSFERYCGRNTSPKSFL